MNALSVIVTSHNSPELLERCLESLAAQKDVREIVVADCSRQDPSPMLREKFPAVRCLYFPEKRTVPQMRWEACRHTTGELLAALEARCVPARNWCAGLLQAHRLNPEAPAIGGVVETAPAARGRSLGLYFCEYGFFAPPVRSGPAKALSGANLSYKRDMLEASRDLLDRGCWETLIHQRWMKEGHKLIQCDARIVFEDTMSLADTLRQRFAYGRVYAAERVEGRLWVTRLPFVLFTPLLPALLTVRLARAAWNKGRLSRFLGVLGWVILFNSAWAVGECLGYLLGKTADNQIY